MVGWQQRAAGAADSLLAPCHPRAESSTAVSACNEFAKLKAYSKVRARVCVCVCVCVKEHKENIAQRQCACVCVCVCVCVFWGWGGCRRGLLEKLPRATRRAARVVGRTSGCCGP